MQVKLTGVGHLNQPEIKTIYEQKNKECMINIASFRRGGYGDGLIENAVISSLKNNFINSKINGYVDISFFQILQNHPSCNSVIPVEWARPLITEVDVRRHYVKDYDLWYDVKPIPFLDGKRSGEYIDSEIRWKLADIETRYYRFNGHEIINFYREMKVKGQPEMFSKVFNIPISMTNAYLPKEGLPDNFSLPQKYATISAGWTETSHYKAWEEHKWNEISEWLHTNGICPVQIGKSREATINHALTATHLSLNQQYSVIDNAMFHMGSDGFFSHVAAVVDIPAVVLWGPTPPEVWGHVNQKDVIAPNAEILWWTHWHWGRDSKCQEMMRSISVEQVKEKIEEVISENA